MAWALALFAAPADAYDFTNTIATGRTYIEGMMETQHIAGLSVALADGANLVWSEGFGWADIDESTPVTAATVFRIGSVAKVFTAAAALQLVDDGLIALDAPFTNYLPEVVLRERYTNYHPTVRELLNYHSGIPGDLLNLGMSTVPYADFTQWLVHYLQDTYPRLPNGTLYNYSNSALILAAEIVERMNAGALIFASYSAPGHGRQIRHADPRSRGTGVFPGHHQCRPVGTGF